MPQPTPALTLFCVQFLPSSAHNSPYWTTNSGAPVWNNNSSETVGVRGECLPSASLITVLLEVLPPFPTLKLLLGLNTNPRFNGIAGPVLLEDYQLVEKIAQFDRERIPERVVHARGASAKGFFEVGTACHVADLGRGPRKNAG